MAPKFDDLWQMRPAELRDALGELKRSQLQAFAKKCGLKANMRTLELSAAIVEHFTGVKAGTLPDGLSPADGAVYPRRSFGVPAGTIHKTPYNPVFNPRYADSTTRGASGKRITPAAPSTSKGKDANAGGWAITKNAELAELEAQLKTIPHRRVTRSTPGDTVTPVGQQLRGTKRKASGVGVGSSDSENLPASKRRAPGTAASVRSVGPPTASYLTIRRPGGKKKSVFDNKPAVPSRFAPSRAAEAVVASFPPIIPTAAAVAEAVVGGATPAGKAQRAAPASAAKSVRTVERARKAQDAHMERMRRARAKGASTRTAGGGVRKSGRRAAGKR